MPSPISNQVRFLLLVCTLFFNVQAEASQDFDGSKGAASAHCTEHLNGYIAWADATFGPGTVTAMGCIDEPSSNWFFCKTNYSGFIQQCGHQGGGFIGYHKYDPLIEDCESGEQAYKQNNDGLPICDGQCEWVPSGVIVCSGGICMGNHTSTGNTCSNSTAPDAPDGCSVSGGTIVCDCQENPAAPFCPGGDANDPDGGNCIESEDGRVTCFSDQNDDPADSGDPDSGQNPDTDRDGDGNPDPDGDHDNDGTPDGSDSDYPGNDSVEDQCTPGVDCEDDLQSAGTSGDCDAPPTCEGPAVECAILVQVWKSNCGLVDMKGNKAPWVDDPDWGRDLKTESEKIDLQSQLDDSGIGSGACPANPQITVIGQSITLDISAICDMAAIIRMFVIMAGWLSAAYIVYRGF